MDSFFLDPNKLILKPKRDIKGIYFVMMGTVKEVMSNTFETRQYIKKLVNPTSLKAASRRSSTMSNLRGIANILGEDSMLTCLDDELDIMNPIYNLQKLDNMMNRIVTPAQHFGSTFDN